MNTQVEVALIAGPLPRAQSKEVAHESPTGQGSAGAKLVFEGVVRLLEEDRQLSALHYEVYEPMTTQELRHLAKRIASEHGLLSIAVEHSVGEVAVGEISFRLTIESKHRRSGLQATSEFIDQMKQNVPLWKTALYAE
jgi:molybdopterin synthase catalytic subunit